MPGQARPRIVKVNGTTQAAFRHPFHDCCAKPTPLRCRHRRPPTLGPAHRQGLALGSPADIYTTLVRRQRPVFPGIGRKLVHREPDGLRGSRLQAQFGAINDDTCTDNICEMRKLGADQVLDIHSSPFIPNEQLLAGRERLHAFGEALDEIFGVSGRRLTRNGVHDGADEAHHPSLTPNALKISEPMNFYPADLTVWPLDTALMRVGFWMGGIKRRVGARPKQFRIVRMYPLLDLLNRNLVGDDIENFAKARVP